MAYRAVRRAIVVDTLNDAMDEHSLSAVELEFPLTCHFKVITIAASDAEQLLREALHALVADAPLEKGNASRGGAYQTFNLSLMVSSREHMHSIDTALRSVPGVKYVM